ncbi:MULTISPECIES: EscU/YscU/HrcU family type III secretion system export apparatus switch protein [unclassified Undibacterium]|uniref:EscU/YscU/HrcU family type III secretion system export apparatus switch protein n=1 Tax=unclassified Undibacterium TaxID=2630295 RepID=UPI002AC8F8FD|nr:MULTISPECIES: EscU/YscU/HrcU family type III secretion system export apparatus switch protein [unclassified Undibacterium]MEB0140385.1 EscU/YscU/HrcU family type III secretion system export apparatus switch protein [Undibacterium sp. CCC2.1]MEB0173419.1 EscU/YscU/HrcU family type III secretion system export apparatus switch protein [Undibacterium sp. CCC1.1]MEB0177319.1 EscU/YscU/HrcU family type III secretion system export apparatus switch protein [Undibacterium sp. CCC3.4]MEB0216576.1 EscU
MAASKSELPTEKKKSDSAKKGQSFKSRDLITACLLLSGLSFVIWYVSLSELMLLYRETIANQFKQGIAEYSGQVLWLSLKIILPVVGVCLIASALPTLLQTKFVLAFDALKLNFDALNPVNGFKKMFSLRTVKELVKALLYLSAFCLVVVLFFDKNKALLLAQIHSSPAQLVPIWRDLLMSLLLTALLCIVLIIILDALTEYFLTIKDMKMEKQEVKREHKEQDGDPEIKHRRREFAMELLSEQVKSDIENSSVIVANPTHLAIGIYFKPEIVPIPFISVIEANQRALAVRAYAAKVGVPVVRDIALARRLYRKHSPYSFINTEELGDILRILMWLQEMEQLGGNQADPDPRSDEEMEADFSAESEPDNTLGSAENRNKDQ